MSQRIFSDELIVAASKRTKEQEFWLNQLAGPLVKSSFPSDYRKKESVGINKAHANIQFSKKIYSELMNLSKNSDYKLFVILVAGLVVLINNYTDNNDIIIGAPIYKQDIETKFINTVLVLRNPLEEKATFKQLLLQVTRTIFAATENYSYPLELLPEKLNLPVFNGDFAAALFDIVILLENIHDKKYIQHLNNNMTFSFLKTGEHIGGVLTYNSLLYRQETIERIINNFETTLGTLLSNLAAEAASLDILTEKEKNQILYEFNDTGTVYPRAKTIPGLFDRQVERTPDNIALAASQLNQLPEGQKRKESLCHITYRKLAEMADQLAYVLKGKGVAPDLVVGIVLDQSIEMILAILGILKAGGAYLPIEPASPKDRMLYMLEDSQVNLVLTTLAILEQKSFTRIRKLNPGNGPQVFVTPLRPQIENIESIGLPDRSLVNYERYNQYLGQSIFKNYMTIQAARGGPYECAYRHKIRPKENKKAFSREIIVLDMIQDTLAKENPGSLKWKPDPHNLAYVIYTSGSTGNPKGVPITHANISPLLHWGCGHLGIGPADRTIQNISYFFDWSVWEIFITLISGACLYSLSRKILLDPRALVDHINKNRITVLHITPTHHYYVVNVGYPLPTLKYLFIGAEKLTVDLVKHSIKLIDDDCRLFNMYGPTEAAVISAVLEIHRLTANNYEELSSVPIGTPVGNTVLLVLNSHMHICPIGVTGELYIAGDGLARGYLNNPELTAEKFCLRRPGALFEKTAPGRETSAKNSLLKKVPGKNYTDRDHRSYRSHQSYISYLSYYRTGDLARWLPEGNIEFLGRKDYQVKVRGFRIELGEIETRLLNHKHIKEAVVLSGEGTKDDPDTSPGKLDHCLYAYIAADQPLEIQEIKDFLAGELPDYMIPSYIEQLDRMPLTPNGKIDRKALKPPQWKTGPDYVPPRDEVERKLAVIWSEVLQVEKKLIGINSNFFDLGGNSLSATVLISKLHKTFDVKIPLMIFFTTPTIRELAIYVKQSPPHQEHFLAIETAEDKEYHRLSSDQKRLYILQQMDPASTVYNVSEMVKLEGKLEKNRLEGIFKELINRHESLRTSFEIVNNEPVQKISAQVALAIEFYHQDWQPGGNQSWRQYDCVKGFIRPFALSQAPLLRLGLIEFHRHHGPALPQAAPTNRQKENPDNWYILMVDMHHIITDGTSMALLIKEFMALYAGWELPALRLQYIDYTEWQSHEKQQEAIKQQEKYWLTQFAGEIPLLALPLDFPRPDVKSTAGDRRDFIIEKDLMNKLKTLAVEKGVTLYMLFLAIFNILLYKISGQEDIIVGSDTAGRGHADLQHVIGMFVNTLALRNYPAGIKTFAAFLEEVKKRTLEAFDNQDYQFERLVEKVAAARDPGRNPIFDVTFYFYGINDMGQDLSTKMKIPLLDLEVLDNGLTSSKFDLAMHVIESENNLTFTFEYCTKLFKTQKIQAFAVLFQEVVSAVLTNPGTRLQDITLSMHLMTEEEEEVKLDDLDF